MKKGLAKFIGKVGRPASSYLYVHVFIMQNDGHGRNSVRYEMADLFKDQESVDRYLFIVKQTFTCKSQLIYVKSEQKRINREESWIFDQKIQDILYKNFLKEG